jgi:hypothetical protein
MLVAIGVSDNSYRKILGICEGGGAQSQRLPKWSPERATMDA